MNPKQAEVLKRIADGTLDPRADGPTKRAVTYLHARGIITRTFWSKYRLTVAGRRKLKKVLRKES